MPVLDMIPCSIYAEEDFVSLLRETTTFDGTVVVYERRWGGLMGS